MVLKGLPTPPDPNAPADCVLTRPERSRGGFIDNDHGRIVRPVGLFEDATFQEGDAHRAKIIAPHDVPVDDRVLPVRGGKTFRDEVATECVPTEGYRVGHADTLDTGKALQRLGQIVIEPDALVHEGRKNPQPLPGSGIWNKLNFRRWHSNASCQDIGGIEPLFDRRELHETVQKQTGTDGQEHRQPDLNDDERLLEPPTDPSEARRLRTTLEALTRVGFRAEQCRCRPENNSASE